MSNPYVAPQTPPFAPPQATPAFKPIERLQYMRMYQYIFENPNWVTNVLLAGLCGLIPVVGPIVCLGYQYEIMVGMLMSGGKQYPDFDFNKFADYLMRGLWPFLVQLVASLVLVPILMVIFIVPFLILMGLGSAAGKDGGPIVFLIGVPLLVLISIPVSILPAMLLIPMQMRAGLALQFEVAFNFNWIMDFLKKIWLEMFLGLLFLSFSAVLLVLIGYIACIVGVFFTMALIYLAQAHLFYELYLLYLSRGGEAAPIKQSPTPQPAGH